MTRSMHSKKKSSRGVLANRRRCVAFTLVELLVVMAIIGVLVGLLLPAVQAAREAARRMQCSNHLVQLGMAIHNYEMVHQVYPPGTLNDRGPIQHLPNGYHHNWIVQILPFIEQRNVYRNIDQNQTIYAKVNARIRAHEISLLRCPSNASTGPYSNYAAVHHDSEAPIDVTNNGVFFLNSRVRYDDISDGTSHTLFVGEKDVDPYDLGWSSGTRASLRNLGLGINRSGAGMMGAVRPTPRIQSPPPGVERTYTVDSGISMEGFMFEQSFESESYGMEDLDQTRDSQASDSSDEEGKPSNKADSETTAQDRPAETPPKSAPEVAYNQDDPTTWVPISKLPGVIPAAPNNGTGVGGFSSAHTGGSQFLRGDGSVHFLSQSIDPKVLRGLGNRSGGELPSAEY